MLILFQHILINSVLTPQLPYFWATMYYILSNNFLHPLCHAKSLFSWPHSPLCHQKIIVSWSPSPPDHGKSLFKSVQKLFEFLVTFKSFQKLLEFFEILQVSGCFQSDQKLSKCLEISQGAQKLSRVPWNFPECIETFTIFILIFTMQKLSGIAKTFHQAMLGCSRGFSDHIFPHPQEAIYIIYYVSALITDDNIS